MPAPIAAEKRDPDEGLVVRARAGDHAAFEALVLRHRRSVHRVAARIVDNESDAEDIAQDTLLYAFRNLSSFRGDARFGTWLHHVARNMALIRLRTERRHDPMSPQDLERAHDHRGASPPGSSPAHRIFETKELAQRVAEAVSRLGERYRAVLELRVVDGLTTEQAARALSTSLLTVRQRLFRARHMIREIVADEARAA